jgi:hypothetical protein
VTALLVTEGDSSFWIPLSSCLPIYSPADENLIHIHKSPVVSEEQLTEEIQKSRNPKYHIPEHSSKL